MVRKERTAPELRALEALSVDVPIHWSAVARQLHLRPGSTQQYLSRLSRQGLARRISAGWYVGVRQAGAPVWKMSEELKACVDTGVDITCAWSSSQFLPLCPTLALPDFFYLTTTGSKLAGVRTLLTDAGYLVLSGKEPLTPQSKKQAVLLRSSAERSGHVDVGVLATPDRALIELLLEAIKQRVPLEQHVLETLTNALFAQRVINISTLRRMAMRRNIEVVLLDLLRAALPSLEKRALRAVLS